ncbi:MAG: hypothetical protein LBR86_00650 [Tannerella sp.]|jgi:hypothetical protein|nr:hypothetical protein [Tannerella sp.]
MNRFLKKMGEAAGFDEPVRTVYFIGANRYEDIRELGTLLILLEFTEPCLYSWYHLKKGSYIQNVTAFFWYAVR